MSHERMAPRWPKGWRPRHFFGVSFPAAVFTTVRNGQEPSAFVAHSHRRVLDQAHKTRPK